MYSVVMMVALTGSADLPDLGRHRRGGSCCGCYGGGYSGGGCYGGGYSSGCYGGSYSSGCYGGGYSSGCYGSGYGSCYGGGTGGCYGGYSSGCCGCYGGAYSGCYGGGTGGLVISGGGPEGIGAPGAGGAKSADDKKHLNEMLKAYKGNAKKRKEIQDYYNKSTPAEWRKYYSNWKKANPEEARTPGPATLYVTLPADAKLTIDGEATHATASLRVFVTPPLPTGKAYHYTLRAEFVRDAKPVVVTKYVTVRAGQETLVTIPAATPTVARR